jgi:hypothetical protein
MVLKRAITSALGAFLIVGSTILTQPRAHAVEEGSVTLYASYREWSGRSMAKSGALSWLYPGNCLNNFPSPPPNHVAVGYQYSLTDVELRATCRDGWEVYQGRVVFDLDGLREYPGAIVTKAMLSYGEWVS